MSICKLLKEQFLPLHAFKAGCCKAAQPKLETNNLVDRRIADGHVAQANGGHRDQ